ncbi:hypothetical protein NPIL_14421 [Nephila pilipes]|uniref:Uncharacterized protein n=1 Tax=Nephila pilipes TaxID=299642 RepID=A0A8X6P4V8_NEPPI|nr:hypothetical protein NPIL_69671 [Nephila pilipes]GFT51062.1 hypothetical protein NPIL_14421 [Nephila pilipes]
MESAKTKTTEIPGKLDLLLPCPVQNCPIHPKVAKKRALDSNIGENSNFISPKKTAKQLKLNKSQSLNITKKFSILKTDNQSEVADAVSTPPE